MNILHVCANQNLLKRQFLNNWHQLLVNLLSLSRKLINVDLYDEKPLFFSYELYKRVWYPVFNSEYEPSKAEEMSTN